MNYSAIRTCDIADGPGVRVSLFVSGCTHCCKGCFNESTWDFARERFPQKDVWAWTGCVYERELLKESPWRCEVTDEMLSLIDVLVDGPFVESLKDISLRFRGSSNQRILDRAARAAL